MGGTIESGQSRKIAKGDFAIIPAGVAHAFSSIDGSIEYLRCVSTPIEYFTPGCERHRQKTAAATGDTSRARFDRIVRRGSFLSDCSAVYAAVARRSNIREKDVTIVAAAAPSVTAVALAGCFDIDR